MTNPIAKAYAVYEATISPAAVKTARASASGRGAVTAASIRAGALLTLQAAIEKELAR